MSVYWFAILFIVAGAVVYMTAMFYGAPKDIRNIESRILANKIADCFSEGGYVKENIYFNEKLKTNLLGECNINFAVEDFGNWKEKPQYYLEVAVHRFDSNLHENAGEKVFNFSEGDINLREIYLLKHPEKERVGREIDMVIIHFTASSNLESAQMEFKNTGKGIHYLVDKDGTIVEGDTSEGESAVHTNSREVNSRSIGIEIVNLGDMCSATTGYCSWDGGTCKQICQDAGNGELKQGVFWEKFTPEQITALENLVSGIVSRYDIPVDEEHIKGHSEIDPSTRTDPGPLFPWNEFMANVKNEGEKAGLGRNFYVIDEANNQYVVKILPLIGKNKKNEI